jgi:hypothetical protein
MTDEIILLGNDQNVRLLAREIANRPELIAACRVRVTAASDAADDSLGYGPVSEIIISLTSGVATNATYDLLRSLISRARDRGDLTERQGNAQQETENDASEDRTADEDPQ